MARFPDVEKLSIEGGIIMNSTFTSTGRTGVAEATKEIRDEIVDWLRDAYSMERGLETSLQKQSQDNDLDPAMRECASTHLEETKRHAQLVRSALQSLDADTSALKTAMGTMGQGFKGLSSQFARDQHIKDLLDAYMMEHFEIACYTSLEAAAEHAGFTQVGEMCRQIIPDEERMAATLIDAIPQETVSYLFKEAHQET
jgi:ferritin-like metal-binding protein YciE